MDAVGDVVGDGLGSVGAGGKTVGVTLLSVTGGGRVGLAVGVALGSGAGD